MFYDRTEHIRLNRNIIHLKNKTKTPSLTKFLLVSLNNIPVQFRI